MRLSLDHPAKITSIDTISKRADGSPLDPPLVRITAVEPDANPNYSTHFEFVVGTQKLNDVQKDALRNEPVGKWITFQGSLSSSARQQGEGYFNNVVVYAPTLVVMPADAVAAPQQSQPQAAGVGF